MSELVTFISTVLGIVVTCGFGIRWIFNVWYTKEKQLADFRHDHVVGEIKEIKQYTSEIKSVFANHAEQLKSLQLSVEKTYMRYNAQTDSIKVIGDDLRETTRELKSELKSVQTQIIQLGQDLLLYRSRKN